jgi:hypothetical protein
MSVMPTTYSRSNPASPSSRKHSAPSSSPGQRRYTYIESPFEPFVNFESPFVKLEMYDLTALFDVDV